MKTAKHVLIIVLAVLLIFMVVLPGILGCTTAKAKEPNINSETATKINLKTDVIQNQYGQLYCSKYTNEVFATYYEAGSTRYGTYNIHYRGNQVYYTEDKGFYFYYGLHTINYLTEEDLINQ